jgi:hypothetical protein
MFIVLRTPKFFAPEFLPNGRPVGLKNSVFSTVECLVNDGFIAFRTRTSGKELGTGATVSQELLSMSPSPTAALGLLPSRALSSESARRIVQVRV